MLILTKKDRDRRIMQEVVMQEMQNTCQRIVMKTKALKEKLSNGGGQAIIQCLTDNRPPV